MKRSSGRTTGRGKLKAKHCRGVRVRASHKRVKATRRLIASRKRRQKAVIFKTIRSRPASINAAAQGLATQLGISVEAARSRLRSAASHPDRAHGNRLLTDSEELMLTSGLEAAALVNTPLSKREFIDFAKDCFPALRDRSLTSWATDFLARHSDELSVHTVKGLTSSRMSPVTLQDVLSWMPAWRNYLTRNGLSDKFLVNVDETRLKITFDNPNRKAITSSRRHKYSTKESRTGGIASYLPFICADGSIVMDVFIIPTVLRGKVPIPTCQLNRETRGSHPTFWAFTDSGCIDAALFLKCLEKFKEEFAKAHPGLDPIVILDNLSAHKTRDVLQWATSKHVHLFFLPPETTHFLNPLDAEAFTVLKRVLETEFNLHVSSIATSGRSIAEAVLAIAVKAREHLTPIVIEQSYRSTGIYPWDEDLIKNRAKLNIGEIPIEVDPDSAAYNAVVTSMVKTLANAQHEAAASHVKVPRKVAKSGQLFSGEEMLVAIHKDEEAKAAKAADKQARRQQRASAAAAHKATKAQRKRQREEKTCQGNHRDSKRAPAYRGGTGWTGCRYCEAFFLCPKCTRTAGELLQEHEQKCDHLREDNSGTDEPAMQDEEADDADMDGTSEEESDDEQPLKRGKK